MLDVNNYKKYKELNLEVKRCSIDKFLKKKRKLKVKYTQMQNKSHMQWKHQDTKR